MYNFHLMLFYKFSVPKSYKSRRWYNYVWQNFITFYRCVLLHFSFKFFTFKTPVDLKLILRNLYTSGAIGLKRLTLYLTKRMVISFGIIGFLLAINFIAFWGVAPCNLVDCMSVVGENVTWAEFNSVMYFDLYAFPLSFGDRGSRVDNVLCFKSEGRWVDPRWRQWIFHWYKKLPIELWTWGRLCL